MMPIQITCTRAHAHTHVYTLLEKHYKLFKNFITMFADFQNFFNMVCKKSGIN